MASRWRDVALTPSTRPVKFKFNFYAESAPSASLQPFHDRQAATFMFLCAFIMICRTCGDSDMSRRVASAAWRCGSLTTRFSSTPSTRRLDGVNALSPDTVQHHLAELHVLQEEDAIFKVVHLVM